MIKSNLEKLISQNLQYITLQSIKDEFIQVNQFYKLYIRDIDFYIDSINIIIQEIDSFYKYIYSLCLQRIDGLICLSDVGPIFIFTLRYLEYVRNQWNYYKLRFKTFFNTFNKFISHFYLKIKFNV